jgi:hydroxyacyl-ACP dehydratase HTD2-like protein with hotdog domain
MSKLEKLNVGDQLTTLEKHPSHAQLFRYSAITWNAHKIHYDTAHAHEEGHPDVLVQQHLHGAVIQELVMDWLGSDGLFAELSWQNVGRAVPDEPLYVGAEVKSIDNDGEEVKFDVWTANDDGRCAEGTVLVRFD